MRDNNLGDLTVAGEGLVLNIIHMVAQTFVIGPEQQHRQAHLKWPYSP